MREAFRKGVARVYRCCCKRNHFLAVDPVSYKLRVDHARRVLGLVPGASDSWVALSWLRWDAAAPVPSLNLDFCSPHSKDGDGTRLPDFIFLLFFNKSATVPTGCIVGAATRASYSNSTHYFPFRGRPCSSFKQAGSHPASI